jgi:hypothetical protein
VGSEIRPETAPGGESNLARANARIDFDKGDVQIALGTGEGNDAVRIFDDPALRN